jgi:ABC-type multidrug transport system ATPase subunit
VIFMASHNLDELQRLADRVAIIDRGRLQRIVTTRGATAAAADGRTPYRIAVARGGELVPEVFPGAREVVRGEYEVPPADLVALNRGVAELVARGALISMLGPVHTALEQQFREAVGDRT